MKRIAGLIKRAVTGERIRYLMRTVLIVATASLVSIFLSRNGVMKENVLMVFLIGVLLIGAFTAGYEYGIIGAVVSVLMFNYFFTVPVHTFAIMDPNDVALMTFFLVVSCISSGMTARFRRQLAIAEANEKAAKRMSEMSERFINVTGKEQIIALGLAYIRENTGYEASVSLKGCEEENRRESGYILFPISGAVQQIGVLKIFTKDRGIGAEQEIFIRAAASQMGIALDRELIYSEQEKIKLEVEKEHLKSSMLRSISHDFRTPLTGIIGDCDLILQKHAGDDSQAEALVRDIREQSMWLTHTMENILSMTKIENGTGFIDKEEEVVEDLVYEAERHITGLRTHRRFKDSMPEELLVANVDGRMIVQVLVNLLDNAVKNTEEGGRITLNVSYKSGKVYFVVEDNGRGIEPGQEKMIFEEFVSSGGKGPDQKHGIGLGLAICKEVVEAHGGSIWAENRLEGGARFTFWLNAETTGET